jgi:hypothetical protein
VVLERAGLAAATLVLIVLGAYGGRRVRVLEVAGLYVTLLALAGVLFVRLLGLPLRMLP